MNKERTFTDGAKGHAFGGKWQTMFDVAAFFSSLPLQLILSDKDNSEYKYVLSFSSSVYVWLLLPFRILPWNHSVPLLQISIFTLLYFKLLFLLFLLLNVAFLPLDPACCFHSHFVLFKALSFMAFFCHIALVY